MAYFFLGGGGPRGTVAPPVALRHSNEAKLISNSHKLQQNYRKTLFIHRQHSFVQTTRNNGILMTNTHWLSPKFTWVHLLVA
jgi:hypothetical protein